MYWPGDRWPCQLFAEQLGMIAYNASKLVLLKLTKKYLNALITTMTIRPSVVFPFPAHPAVTFLFSFFKLKHSCLIILKFRSYHVSNLRTCFENCVQFSYRENYFSATWCNSINFWIEEIEEMLYLLSPLVMLVQLHFNIFVWSFCKVSVFGGSVWEWEPERQQYYLHQFLKEQPDLNFKEPEVQEEMKVSLIRCILN